MYILIIDKEARSFLRHIPRVDKRAIGYALHRLQMDPKEGDIKKLKGSPLYRLRVGNYRVIYGIDHGKVVITVIEIVDRKDAY